MRISLQVGAGLGRSSLGSDPIKLEQIDRKKDHVQENNGIDMCEQTVETK
jgi:hypothetical protein